MFNVGDRVKVVSHNGARKMIPVGSTATVIRVWPDEAVELEGDLVWIYRPRDIELLQPEVQPEREELTFYCVIGRNPQGSNFMTTNITEAEATQLKRIYEDMRGYEVLAMKKIKVKV